MRKIASASLLLLSSLSIAHAQEHAMPTTVEGLYGRAGTWTAPQNYTTAPMLNYLGLNAFSVVPSGATPSTNTAFSLKIGPGAGASLANPSGGNGSLAIGAYAMGMETGGGNETVALGEGACAQQVGQFANVCVGQSSGLTDPAMNYTTIMGNDSGRDATGLATSSIIGAQDADDGQFTGPNTVMGFQALKGSAGTLELTNAALTIGDVYRVTLTTAATDVSGVPGSALSYTVATGATVTSVANAIAALINAANVTIAPPVPTGMNQYTLVLSASVVNDTSGNAYITMHFPGGNTTGGKMTYAVSCTGTCGAVLSSLGPTTAANNDIFGVRSLGSIPTNALNNVLIGDNIADFATAPVNNAAVGTQSLADCTTCSYNAELGYQTAFNSLATQYSVHVGFHAGFNDNGAANVILGAMNGSEGCVTGGAYSNTLIGYEACLPNPSGNFQFVIQDSIYGLDANVQDHSGALAALVGIDVSAPTFPLTIGDGAGHGSNHWGLQQTTKLTSSNLACTGGTGTLDSYAQDGAFILTGANGITACAITFAHPYSQAIWQITPTTGGALPTSALVGSSGNYTGITLTWGTALSAASKFVVSMLDRQ